MGGGVGGWRSHTLTSPRRDLSSPGHQSLDVSSAEDLEARGTELTLQPVGCLCSDSLDSSSGLYPLAECSH